MDLRETARQIHENAKAKGFWDKEPNTGEKLMLIVSEVSEAMEADRKGNHLLVNNHNKRVVDESNDEDFLEYFKAIKNTFPDELADAVIRILDLSCEMNIDLEWHIKAKMRYNAMRPHMHGKKY